MSERKASKLRVLRIIRGWTVIQVAAQVGCHPDLLRRIEKRLNTCPEKWQGPIAALFGLPAEELFDPESGLARAWEDGSNAP